MKILGVIPARFDSRRFPGKVLFKISGKSLLQWVYENASRSRLLSKIIIATDDERVAKCAREFGAEVFVSRRSHNCGSERVAEAAAGKNYRIVVNIQADEIAISPEIIRLAVRTLKTDSQARVATVAFPIADQQQLCNPDLVKVVVDNHRRALYFSRSTIPYNAESAEECVSYYGHIGVYAFRSKYLQQYAGLRQGPLEKSEKLEQLRILEHGGKVVVAICKHETLSINRRADINKLKKIL